MEYMSIMENSTAAYELYKTGLYQHCLTTLREIPEKYLSDSDKITRLMAYLNLGCYNKCYEEASNILTKVDNNIARRVVVQSCLMTGQYTLADSHINLLDESREDIKPVLNEMAEARAEPAMPPWVAAMGGHIDALKQYLESHDVNVTFTSGRLGPGSPSLLFLAAANGQTDVIKFLVTKGADVNVINNGWSALHMAILLGYIDVVVTLLELGADVNIKPSNLTPVQLAAALNHGPLITLLAAHKADLAAPMPPIPNMGVSEDVMMTKETRAMRIAALRGPAHFHAAAKGHADALAALLAAGGWGVNQPNPDAADATLLHMATGRGAAGDRCHLGAVKVLMEAKADVNAKTTQGYTALHFAARTNDEASVEVLDVLVDAGAELDANTTLKETPLVAALCSGSTIAVRKLLSLGADVAAAEAIVRQPLAAWSVLAEMPQMLAAVLEGVKAKGGEEAAVTVARAESEGAVTALHWACLKGDFVSTALLLRYGAICTSEAVINGQKVTPLRCSRLYNVGRMMGATQAGMRDCEDLVVAALKKSAVDMAQTKSGKNKGKGKK